MQLHIEAMQTAVPTRVVEPGRSRRITVPCPLTAEAAQRRFRVVFYYRRNAGAGPGDEAAAAWSTMVAWIKESLSAALADQPEMAGRLRRGDSGGWEVKFTDTGVRLLQASVEMTMSEFLEMKDREAKEAGLAPWTDVDVEDPDSSALCFMQVTRFQGDGFALGISCSLLLSDPLSLIRFLKSWAQTHTQMLAQGKLSDNPMLQYLNYFQGPGHRTSLKSIPLDAAAATGEATCTVLFRATNVHVKDERSRRALASACIDQAAAERLGGKKVSRFSVVSAADGGTGGLKIEPGTVDGEGPFDGSSSLRVAQWRETGIEELALKEGSKPMHVSYSVVSTCADEGLVVVMPGDAEFLISATVPKLKKKEEI